MVTRLFILVLTLSLTTCGAYAASCDIMYGGILDTESEYELCGDYAVGYDADLKSPLWVAYSVSRQSLIKVVKRHGSFRSDHRLSKRDRVYSSWYTRSGYDRGHMAPAINFRYSKNSERDAFVMSNIVPQLPGVNRGIWRSLEYRTQKTVRKYGQVVVITGPIYNNVNTAMIKNKIRIPSSFYKIIVRNYPRNAISFIIPNVKPAKGYKLISYVVSVDDIEAVTGFDFLSNYAIKEQTRLESSVAAASLWPIILR